MTAAIDCLLKSNAQERADCNKNEGGGPELKKFNLKACARFLKMFEKRLIVIC